MAMTSSGPPDPAIGKEETHELADFRETRSLSRTSTSVSESGHDAQGSSASHVPQETASFASTEHAPSEDAEASNAAQVAEPSQLCAAVLPCCGSGRRSTDI